MSKLSKQIRESDDIMREVVPIHEWGVTLEVRSLSANERSLLIEQFSDDNGADIKRLYPALAIASCYDPESGEKVFSSSDASWLGEKNGAVLDRIGTLVMQGSKIGDKAIDKEGK